MLSRASGQARRRRHAAPRDTRARVGICTSPCVKRWPYEEPPKPSTVRVVELRAEPADGPRKAEARVVPAHRLREREPADDLVQPLGQRLEERPARDEHAQQAVAHLEVAHRDTLLLRKALGSPFPQVLGRPLDPLVRLPLGEVVHEQHEPARADKHAALSQLRQLGAKLRLRLSAGRGGQLLAPDLKQQAGQSSPRRAGRPCARACEPGRCTRRAPSPRWRRARPEG